MEPILIRRNKDPYGWMGNMSPYPVTHQGIEYRTTEAMFQALRFNDEEVIELIRLEKSPMAAKMVAKKHKHLRVIVPCSNIDVECMRLCLWSKINDHRELMKALYETENREIIEDCTKRQGGSGLFWGAALVDGKWVGENQLGKLWMEIRFEISPLLEIRLD